MSHETGDFSADPFPGPETEQTTEPEHFLGPRYKVLLHNDDVNPMEHVVRAIMKVFCVDAKRAYQVMFEAHKSGAALCAVEYLEHAEFHRDQMRAHFLTATIEEEN